MELRDIEVHAVRAEEEPRYRELMQAHHYLGSLPKIGETVWYVARWREHWAALVSFSAAALKCEARDRWIGWSYRQQYDRLKLVVNNSRFLILPDWHVANLGSRVLSLCQKRLPDDWQKQFGHRILLLETFVDPQWFHGTVYRAANWLYAGQTKGFRRTTQGYSATATGPKMVFLKPLRPDARVLLSAPALHAPYLTGRPKLMLEADHMRSLFHFFVGVPDPRRGQGRRHHIATVLSIAAGAVLCGMHGYQAISDWAQSLGQKARERFRCRNENGRYVVPSLSIIRDVLIRVDPDQLDQAIQRWNAVHGPEDRSLAIDGKTMCNAIDEEGPQTHVMSVIGHQSKVCLTQKK